MKISMISAEISAEVMGSNSVHTKALILQLLRLSI